MPIPKHCATISSVCNFVPSWDEVKSVQKLCRFITSSFILQEKAHSDDKILLSILSVLAGAVFPDGMTAMTGMTGILGCPAAVTLTGEHPGNAWCRGGAFLAPRLGKRHPCGRKNLRFFRLRFQGVTHYTLQARPCARRSLWTPFLRGCAPRDPPGHRTGVTVVSCGDGIPDKPSPLSTPSPRKRTMRRPALVRRYT